MKFTVKMSDDQTSRCISIETENLSEAIEEASEQTIEWIEGGEWPPAGGEFSASWELRDEEGNLIEDGMEKVEIPPDEGELISQAGGDSSCEHEFASTYEVEGGIRENPGVWGVDGGMVFRSHCKKCGVKKTTFYPHGGRKEVSYEAPEEEPGRE